MSSPIDIALVIAGEVLVSIGVFCGLVAAIGMLRFPNFFVRLHAATVGSIGGAFVPIIGAALIALGSDFLAYRGLFFGSLLVTAVMVMLVSPAGSHALARATHRAKVTPVEPKVADHLEEDESRRKNVHCSKPPRPSDSYDHLEEDESRRKNEESSDV